MKKILFLFALGIIISSCTENYRAKSLGGTMTIKLESGKKLVEATWKESQLWYLVEPMEDNYVPKTKEFIEESEFGIMEGKVLFVESR